MLLTALATLDGLLYAHAAELGTDFTGYRNHAYRVVNLCVAFSSADPVTLEKITIAAACHDLGIWTAHTFDYLQPSADLAIAHLQRTGHDAWTEEIAAMIFEHHKLSPCDGHEHPLVEPFRRSDWVDVSRGLITFGLPRELFRDITAQWPSAGFHRRLVELSLARLRTHPLSPLPMLRL